MKLPGYKYLHKIIIGLLTLIMAQSCISKSKSEFNSDLNDTPLKIRNVKYRDIPSSHVSESADTLIVFHDIYPVGVRIFNGNIFIKAAMSDTCILVYDKESLSPIWKTGVKGNGPEDVLTPTFFASVNNDSLGRFQMTDVSDNSHIYIDPRTKELTKSRLPDYTGYSSSINSLENYFIATKNTEECMFYIHNKDTKETLPVMFDIDCGQEVKSKLRGNIGYMLSAMTYANEDNNRIIVPHYFFDIYSVYDFSGRLLRKISLSEDYNEKTAAENLLLDNGYIGFSPGFIDSKACYLLRTYSSSSHGEAESMQIVKTDWEGTPVMVYALDTPLTGEFCIYENKLYGIAKTPSQDTETYALICWNLQKT